MCSVFELYEERQTSFEPAFQVEQQVFHFLKEQNRPYSTQLVADNLAQFGVKKGPIQKALDSLSEAAEIICKVGTLPSFHIG